MEFMDDMLAGDVPPDMFDLGFLPSPAYEAVFESRPLYSSTAARKCVILRFSRVSVAAKCEDRPMVACERRAASYNLSKETYNSSCHPVAIADDEVTAGTMGVGW